MNILLSYYDPFGGKPTNNSEIIAKMVAKNLMHIGHKVELCELPTIFDKAFEQLADCIHSASEPFDFVASFGEAGCHQVKIETRAKNYDKSRGADNDGIERHGQAIIPGAAKALGVTLPMDQAYCSLDEKLKKQVYISEDAGSFVCNNTLYYGLTKLDIPYTFLHVPSVSCSSESKNKVWADTITQLLNSIPKYLDEPTELPASKREVKAKLKEDLSSCERKFYNILRAEY